MVARRILIVDDEAADAGALASTLVALGYEVSAIAASGEDAMIAAAAAPPDLALVKLSLGGLRTGVQTAGQLRGLRSIPIVFTTGESDERALRASGVLDPYGYVVAPFTARELRVNVELALCQHDAARTARELEDRFFALSIDMLCFLGFDGYFRRLNPAWERVLGFTREELLSRPFIEFVHPDDRERTLAQNRRVREGGQALAFENRYVCKDGSHRWFLWNAASDVDASVIYSVARDVTERRTAEEERERMVTALQAALAEVKSLRSILPICSYCRKIRDDENYWDSVESYVARHTNTQFSHGICPSCMESVVEPELRRFEDG